MSNTYYKVDARWSDSEDAMRRIEVGDFLEIQENGEGGESRPTNVIFVEVVQTRSRFLLWNDVDIWVKLPNGKVIQLFEEGDRYSCLSEEMRAELTEPGCWSFNTSYYWRNYRQDMIALAEQMRKYPGSHVERRRNNLEQERRAKQEEAKRQQLAWQRQQDAAKYVNDFFKNR